MANCGHVFVSKLIAARIKDLNDSLYKVKSKTDSKIPATSAYDVSLRELLDEKALEFLDGSLLFHVFPSLKAHLRQRLVELNLPLKEICDLKLELRIGELDVLEPYFTTNEEAETRTAKIINELDTSHHHQEPAILSYNDTEPRDTLENCVVTLSKTCLAMFENMNATHALYQSTSGKDTYTQPTLGDATNQSTVSQASASNCTTSKQDVSQNYKIDQPSVDVNLVPLQNRHEKSLEILTKEQQHAEARRTKFHTHFHEYEVLIKQLKA